MKKQPCTFYSRVEEMSWGWAYLVQFRRIRIFLPNSMEDYTEQWWVSLWRINFGVTPFWRFLVK